MVRERTKGEKTPTSIVLSDELKEKIRSAAAKNNRKTAAEIRARLEESFGSSGNAPRTIEGRINQALADQIIEFAEWLQLLTGPWNESHDTREALCAGTKVIIEMGGKSSPEYKNSAKAYGGKSAKELGVEAAEVFGLPFRKRLKELEASSETE